MIRVKYFMGILFLFTVFQFSITNFLTSESISIRNAEAQPVSREELREERRKLAEQKRDRLKKQNEAWSKLDPSAKKLIAERSKFIYRLENGIILDAYNILNWRESASKGITRKNIYEQVTVGNMTRKKLKRVDYQYRADERLSAYYSVPTYPVHYWYSGLFLNDREKWDTTEYEPFWKHIGVHTSQKLKMSELEGAIHRSLPMLVVVDPLAQMSKDIDLYYKSSTNPDGEVALKKGLVSGVTSTNRSMESVSNASTHRGSIFYGNPKFKLAPDPDLKDGKPKDTLSSYLLVPNNRYSGTQGALGSRSSEMEDILYDIVELKPLKMSPREVAYEFVTGSIEVPYRTLTQSGGSWVCEEKLLERP